MGLEKYENQTIFIFSASSARVLLHETGRDVGTGGIRCASICLLDYNLWLFLVVDVVRVCIRLQLMAIARVCHH